MVAAALKIVEDFACDSEIRVVVLRGDGDRSFISGGDISKFPDTRFDPATAAENRFIFEKLFDALRGLSKPVIAMIHGYCLGGGMAVALCADIRFGPTTSAVLRFAVHRLIPSSIVTLIATFSFVA